MDLFSLWIHDFWIQKLYFLEQKSGNLILLSSSFVDDDVPNILGISYWPLYMKRLEWRTNIGRWFLSLDTTVYVFVVCFCLFVCLLCLNVVHSIKKIFLFCFFMMIKCFFFESKKQKQTSKLRANKQYQWK